MLNITANERKIVQNIPLVFIGCSASSMIAESVLRFGFENILLIDDSIIEEKNIPISNFTENSISQFASEVLYGRLKEIKPNSNIAFFTTFNNLEDRVGANKIIVYSLDLDSKVKHKLFNKNDVIYPFNLGMHSLVTIVSCNGVKLDILTSSDELTEHHFFEYVTSFLKFWNNSNSWMSDISKTVKKNFDNKTKIQNTISSYALAGMCTDLMFKLATKKQVKHFPKFYIDNIDD